MTEEAYVPPTSEADEPLPSVEITEGNIFTGYHTRAATPEDLNLRLQDGRWVSNE